MNDDITKDLKASRHRRAMLDPELDSFIKETEAFYDNAKPAGLTTGGAPSAPAAAPSAPQGASQGVGTPGAPSASPEAAPAAPVPFRAGRESTNVEIQGSDGSITPRQTTEEYQNDYTWYGEVARAVGGSLQDTVKEAVAATYDVNQWVADNLIDLRVGSPTFGATGDDEVYQSAGQRLEVPDLVGANKTTVGKVSRRIGQFLIPFVGALKAANAGFKGTSMAAKFLKGSAAGGVADGFFTDPHEQRLANMVYDWSKDDPNFATAYADYLRADPNDSNMEQRFKSVIEGMMLGTAAEGVFLSLKAAKAVWSRARGGADKMAEGLEGGFDDAVKAREAEKAAEAAQGGFKEEPLKPGEKPADMKMDVDGVAKDPAPVAKEAVPDVEDPIVRARAKQAAARDAARAEIDGPAPTPKALSDNPVRSVVDGLDAAEEALKDRGAARRVWIDPEDMKLSFDKPSGAPKGAIDFDTKVKAALETPAAQRSAVDLVLLREHNKLLEAALQPIARVQTLSGRSIWTGAQRQALDSPIINQAAKDPQRVFSDADRLAIREASEVLDKRIAENAKALDEVIKASRATDAVVDKMRASRGRGQKIGGEGGFISPSMLVHMMASSGGGIANLAINGDDNDTLAEKLAKFGAGAALGLGISVGGKAVVKRAANMRAANKAEEAMGEALARKESEGIVPKEFTRQPKAESKIDAATVAKISDAMQSGRLGEMADLIDETDFNFARIDSDEDLEQLINAMTSATQASKKVATGGVQTLEETKALARELGSDPKLIAALYTDTGQLAGRVTVMRQLLAASGERVTKLSKLALDATAAEADIAILAARKQIALHAVIQNRAKGIQTEIARGLSAFRITARASDLRAAEIDSLVQAIGGSQVNRNFLEKLANVGDPLLVHRIAERTKLAKTGGALFEAWVNGVLAGLGTHVVNIIGNASTLAIITAEKIGAAAVGQVRRTLGGSDEAVQFMELQHHLHGLFEGFGDALRINSQGLSDIAASARAFAKGDIHGAEAIIRDSTGLGTTFKAGATNRSSIDLKHSSLEVAGQADNISSANWGLASRSALGTAADFLGAGIRTPGRMLTASDDFFKVLNYRAEIRSTAFRQGRAEGLTGAQLARRVEDLSVNPTEAMSDAALKAARTGTFTTPLGKPGQALTHLANTVPGMRFIVPFIRTPVNILKFVGVRSPVGWLAKSVQAELRAGGVSRDMAIARMTMGAMVMGLAYQMAASGVIVGGGDKRKLAEEVGGRKGYSIKWTDAEGKVKYVQFNRLDPVMLPFGIMADLHDIASDTDIDSASEIGAAAVLLLQRNLASKSYVQGLFQAIAAFQNPEMYGESWIEQFAGSWIPKHVGMVTRANDPYIKSVDGVFEAIKAQLPGLSEEVPNYVNILGEEVKRSEALGPDWLSPIYMSTESEEPLNKAIADLNLDISPVASIIPVDGTPGVKLEPKQHHDLRVAVGKIFKQLGTKVVTSKQWETIPKVDQSGLGNYQDSRAEVLRKVWTKAVRAGKAQFFKDNPAVFDKYKEQTKQKANALTGKPITPIN